MAGAEIPLFSILVPLRDAVTTVEGCLRSIAAQTCTDWECVAVDDGSEDGTPDRVEAFSRRDRRIRLLRTGREGLVPALSTGLEHCRGVLTARIDGDDLMHRRRLELQADALERDRSLDAVGCRVRLFPRRSLGEGMVAYERWINRIAGPEDLLRESFVECPVAHPALTVRTDCLQEFGYRDRGWPEDYDLVLRMLGGGRKIGIVPRRLLSWRHGDGRLSRTDPRYSVSRFTDCKAHFLCESFLAGAERYALWGYGHTGRAMRRALGRLGKTAAMIIEVHPGRLRNGIRGARVIAPDRLDALSGLPLLVSVAGERPRREIRSYLESHGRVELRDFLCVA